METILNFKCSSEEKEICELENLSDLFLMELHFKKQTGETIINLQKQLQDDWSGSFRVRPQPIPLGVGMGNEVAELG